VHTGKEAVWNFGNIVSFNGKTNQENWGDGKCDAIKGTDGTVFPPFVDEQRKLDIFYPDVCRTIQMEYVSPGEYMGLPTLRFSFAKSVFGSLKEFPENSCYCKDTFEWCEKGGLMALGPCLGGM
jgi:scavenger receptor class B protein 1